MNPRRLIKKVIPAGLFPKIEPYGHLAEAIAENVAYGFPARNLKVIGVTGTAGKTTVCTLITHLLRASGYKVAMMTTIAIDYGDGRGPQADSTRMTSLGSLPLLRALKRISKTDVEWLVLETTSHALAQHRVWGVPYSIVAFTNLSHDNADYHGSFANYRAAKQMLFTQCDANRRGQRIGVVNADDPNGKYFSKVIAHPVTFGITAGDLRARDIALQPAESRFTATIGQEDYTIVSHLPGSFNVYNTLCAIGVARAVGLTRPQIEAAVASLPSVEGRMNTVDEGQDFSVIVDYAATPDSFEQVFAAVGPLVRGKGRIITVFGSAGRRDVLKRPLQGEIAGQHSDIVILTEEDDRDQDGEAIMREIVPGVIKAGKVEGRDLFLIHEREAAVARAIELARADDVVLLLGKGEERVIITNKPGYVPAPGHIYSESDDAIKRPYNETKVARAALRRRPKA